MFTITDQKLSIYESEYRSDCTIWSGVRGFGKIVLILLATCFCRVGYSEEIKKLTFDENSYHAVLVKNDKIEISYYLLNYLHSAAIKYRPRYCKENQILEQNFPLNLLISMLSNEIVFTHQPSSFIGLQVSTIRVAENLLKNPVNTYKNDDEKAELKALYELVYPEANKNDEAQLNSLEASISFIQKLMYGVFASQIIVLLLFFYKIKFYKKTKARKK